MREFIDEGDLDTFEGWLHYQAVDATKLGAADRALWEGIFREVKQRAADTSKVGRMQLRAVPNEYRYAVAIEDGESLWLTLWVRRSPKGEFFIMLPRGDREWNPHTSYHVNRNLHVKSHGHKFSVQERQPLAGEFKGVVGLGAYYGHGPKGAGAVCDPDAFTGVVKVPSGVLGPVHGGVSVDLFEPGCELPQAPWKNIAAQQIFRDVVPHVAITVGFDHARA